MVETSSGLGGWQEFVGTEEEWDALIVGTKDLPNLYLLAAWGTLRKKLGASVIRLLCRDANGQVSSLAQGTVKNLPFGGKFFLFNGAPWGISSDWGDAFREVLQKHWPSSYRYIRLFSLQPRSADNIVQVALSGWRPAFYRLHSGLTAWLHFPDARPDLLQRASSNWRHNLKRGLKRAAALEVWQDPAVDEMLSIYRAMENSKGLHEQFSPDELSHILQLFREQLVVVRARNEKGETIAFRAGVQMKSHGFDMLAATAAEARENYSAHALIHMLLEELYQKGVRSYDLGGIDPFQGRGVMNFKIGTGAQAFEYVGEWDWANRWWLRLLFNGLFCLRSKGIG